MAARLSAPVSRFLLTIVLSVPMVPLVFLASFRYAGAPPPSKWLRGQGSGSNYLWMLLCFAGQPLLLLFAPGWDGS